MRLHRAIGVSLSFAILGVTLAAQSTGPSTSAPCYVLPNPSLPSGSVQTVALLTVGDAIGGYRMVGIPDGLGLIGDGTSATVFCNHELGAASGITRAHGSTGAFVSRWTLDPATKAIVSGRDHNTAPADVRVYNRTTRVWSPGTTAFNRFCAADLPAATAFQAGGLGTPARIHLNGEEANSGRAFAHIVSGPDMNQSWELPHLGQIAWENTVPSPFPQTKTIVACLDDSGLSTAPSGNPSEVYFYVGNKLAAGNDIEKAGLAGGTLYGVRVSVNGAVVGGESNAFGLGAAAYAGSGTFELVSLGDASTFDGAAQQTASFAANVTRFQRVEDGAFDPRTGLENRFYFVTTASITTNSRLWRLTFTDITQPELGGTIEALLDGSEGHRMLDNLGADAHGRLFLQEDPGNNTRLAKVWMYDLVNGRMIEVAAHDATYFTAGNPGWLTNDEESSGVVPAFDVLGDGWYLIDTQIHQSLPDPELVQNGQLLAMYVDPELGRRFAHWFTAPAGPASLALRHAFGTPGAVVFTGASVTAGGFPNGWFHGIDASFIDLINQAATGAPFLAVLDAAGNLTSATYDVTLLSGHTLYTVAIDDVASTEPEASRPRAWTIN